MSRSPIIVAAALAKQEVQPLETVLKRVLSNGPRDVALALWRDVANLF